VDTPRTKYAKTSDGVYIAYQTVGDGPIEIVWQFDWLGNVDTIWEYRPPRNGGFESQRRPPQVTRRPRRCCARSGSRRVMVVFEQPPAT
jgi:hypothetical protein